MIISLMFILILLKISYLERYNKVIHLNVLVINLKNACVHIKIQFLVQNKLTKKKK